MKLKALVTHDNFTHNVTIKNLQKFDNFWPYFILAKVSVSSPKNEMYAEGIRLLQ